MGKIYIAGKLNKGETSIADLAGNLESRGHEITCKWWELQKLPIPYMEHQETSRPAADKMVEAVRSATTAVILFPDKKILGAMAEFGIALGDQPQNPQREILVVNPFDTRQSVFYAASSVIALRSLEALYDRAWY